ncbi:MAG: divalent-cation tolerance protein CutA [Candidatus Kerfeldbacteria bacterium]|nr:divalent-cation tolerance protein CutA [Candidatus Kerfeldbacteria bacterium]
MKLIVTTVKTISQARKLLDPLFAKHWIACAKFHPITSRYRWNGTLHQESEMFIEMETSRVCAKVAVAWILEHHPYEKPVIRVSQVRANPEAETWVKSETHL